MNRSPQSEKALALLYHRVDKTEKDRWNLCISPENFSEHVRFLSINYKPTRLSDIATQIETGKLIFGSIAVTFDDGYRDNLTTALPILEEHDFPATFFISGEGAVYKNTFWWEMFDSSVREMNLDDDNIIDLHERLMVSSIDERELILSNLKVPSNPLPARLNITDLKQLAQAPLADIGAHSWSHRALSKIPKNEQRKEVIASIEMIKHLTGNNVNSFAYPFGGYFTNETKNLLRDANICLACTVGNEPITSDSDLLALPRIEVGDWAIEDFKLKIRSFFNE